jgi:hypothetical protein
LEIYWGFLAYISSKRFISIRSIGGGLSRSALPGRRVCDWTSRQHRNIGSIIKRSILSHKRAGRLRHASVAAEEIQARRVNKQVPGGLGLHEYANLYICTRNPMMFRRKDRHQESCVLRVAPDVLDIDGVVVADSNAASNYVRFAAAPAGLANVNRALVFAEDWTSQDQIEFWRQKAAKCAEVLVPNVVPPDFILGAYVSDTDAEAAPRAEAPGLAVQIDRHLFVR